MGILSAPNSGQGSAGNTAGPAGNETRSDTSPCEATTTAYPPAANSTGALTTTGVSSSQPDNSNCEGN